MSGRRRRDGRARHHDGAEHGGDGTDTLSSIENLIGSNFADTLSGTAGDNTISGGGNNDDVKALPATTC